MCAHQLRLSPPLLLLCAASAAAATSSTAAAAATDCATAGDCSLAGSCTNGACVCDKGYTGRFCERLREGRTHLLWPPQAGMPWSAGWGASVRRDPSDPGLWHAWVDVICQANRTAEAQPARYVTCYHTQGTNIVHLTASEATGPYSFADVSLGAETNNPHTVVRPSKTQPTWLLFHTNDNKPHPDIATCTGVPNSAPFRNTSNLAPCVGCSSQGSIGIASATDPAGPWSTVFPFVGLNVPGNQGSLANPSPLVLANGTLMLVYRYSNGVVHKASEALAVAVADKAAGPWTFLVNDITALSVEDPALYSGASLRVITPDAQELVSVTATVLDVCIVFLTGLSAYCACRQARVPHRSASVQQHPCVAERNG